MNKRQKNNPMLLVVIILTVALLFLPGTVLAEEGSCTGDSGSSESSADSGSTSGSGGLGSSGSSTDSSSGGGDASTESSSTGETGSVDSDSVSDTPGDSTGSADTSSEPASSDSGDSDAVETCDVPTSQDSPDAGQDSAENNETEAGEGTETTETQNSKGSDAEGDESGSDLAEGNVEAENSENDTSETESDQDISSSEEEKAALAEGEVIEAADGEGNSYVGEITPNGVVGTGEETAFEVTLTEVGSSELGSARITLLEGFSKGDNTDIRVTSSNDSDDGPSWSAFWETVNSELSIALSANDDSAMLGTGQWVKAGFNAVTPASIEGDSETFAFETEAWTDRAAETVEADDGSTNVNNPASGDYSSGSYEYSDQRLNVTVSETIQGAVDAGAIRPGDSIHVHRGTYEEEVTVNKDNLTLVAVEEREAVIKGSLTVKANEVTLKGFTIDSKDEARAAISLVEGDYHTVSNNLVKNAATGISLKGEAGSQEAITISGNEFKTAVGIGNSHDTTNLLIEGNTFRTSELGVRLNEGYELHPEHADTTDLYEANSWPLHSGFAIRTNPYEIRTAQDLHEMRNKLDASYKLMNDIDFASIPDDPYWGEVAGAENYDAWINGKGWEPIGPSWDNTFNGTFDGGGHTISNLFINRPDESFIGLFGAIGHHTEPSEASIINLKLFSVDITGRDHVGALAGRLYVSISSVEAQGEVKQTAGGSRQNIGGLVGNTWSGSEISYSHFEGTVTSHGTHSGGLVGNNSGTITNSSSSGSVVNDGSLNNTGGLVGSNSGTIMLSHSDAAVDSQGGYTGGLVGSNSGTVQDSYASGIVNSSGQYTGGLVGNNEGTITASYFDGSVTVTSTGNAWHTGGLVGNNSGTISASYAEGSVSSTSSENSSYNTGGLVGNNDGTIEDSYATGNVTGVYDVGGLVGWNRGTVNRCYSIGSVTGYNNVGGLVGSEGSAATFKHSFTAGDVTGTGNEVGTIAGQIDHGGSVHNCGASGRVNGDAANQENLFGRITEPMESGFGGGTAENNYPLSPAALKQLATYRGEDWSIAPLSAFGPNPGAYTWYIDEGSDFPILWWQVDEAGLPGDGEEGRGTGTGFTEAFTTWTSSGGSRSSRAGAPGATAPGLTNISRSGNNVITPTFVSTGSEKDLQRAKNAYQESLRRFTEQAENLSPEQTAVFETELAVARAAILALEAIILQQQGQDYDLDELIAAYLVAQNTLSNYRGQLSESEISAAEALLAEIAAVIDAL